MKNLMPCCRVLVLAIACVATLASSSPADDTVVIAFAGSVHLPNGTPAVGAVVVSSAGGRAVTNEEGEYGFETRAPIQAKSVQVTAVGGARGRLTSSQRVALSGAPGPVTLAPMQLGMSSGCIARWLPTFGGSPRMQATVSAVAAFDDGTGTTLFAGGSFQGVAGAPVRFLVKWDGVRWQRLGSGVNNFVNSLLVHDDGSGEALFVGGHFTSAGGMPANYIAKWDGTNWSALAGGRDNNVRAMAVYNDGSGDALVVGSRHIAGSDSRVIAKWDGTSWTGLGSGLNRSLSALAVFDDGNGERLFAGGNFTSAGGVAADYIAAWDGSNWAAVPGGALAQVNALEVFDDGNGAALYAGTDLASGGNLRVLGKWDGASWTALGSGLDGHVKALTSYDDGTGLKLVAGGCFSNAGGVASDGAAAWNGSNWLAMDVGTTGISRCVNALTTYDDGSGEKLIAGGEFYSLEAEAAALIQWDGVRWTPIPHGLNGRVTAVTVFDDGSGPALYAAGSFWAGSGHTLNGIGKWDGSMWSPLGTGFTGTPRTMAVWNDGSGDALYVGGDFSQVSGVVTTRIAKWDGTNWSPLGPGFPPLVQVSTVRCLEVFDDGNGECLYAGGSIENAGGLLLSDIAKWDGTNWATVGSGSSTRVLSMAVHNDGTGDALYAGGVFSVAGGTQTAGIGRWDGTAWTHVGSGLGSVPQALTSFDNGAGARLIAGGDFLLAGGVAANKIAQWDGANWSPLGSGLEGVTSEVEVSALITADDGNGPRLYAGGEFTVAGGVASNNIASWDGAAWSPLDTGVTDAVLAMTTQVHGSGEWLVVGGWFPTVLDSGDSYIGRWGCPSIEASDHCSGDGGDQLGCTNCPCGNNATPGTVGGCLNSALTSSRLSASGDPAVNLLANDTNDLRFSLTGAPANVFCLLNSGDAVAPTNPMNPCFGLDSGAQALLFDGLRCAVTNTRRHGGRPADLNGEVGVTNSPWGGEGGPPVGIAQMGAGYVAGQTRFFQVIHRDDPLAQCMRGLNTSQAVSVTFTAGS